MVRYYVFWLLDTLTFDQHILFFSELFNGFSLAWYSTLKRMLLLWESPTFHDFSYFKSPHSCTIYCENYVRKYCGCQSFLVWQIFVKIFRVKLVGPHESIWTLWSISYWRGNDQHHTFNLFNFQFWVPQIV